MVFPFRVSFWDGPIGVQREVMVEADDFTGAEREFQRQHPGQHAVVIQRRPEGSCKTCGAAPNGEHRRHCLTGGTT